MASLYLNRLSSEDRDNLINDLHKSQNGNCFICGQAIDLDLHANFVDIDHIEPTSNGGKDGPENFALTHDSCNRSKQASDLRVARVLASFDALAELIVKEDRSPNLGDVLVQHGGSRYELAVNVNETSLRTTFSEMGQNDVRSLPCTWTRYRVFVPLSSICQLSTCTTMTTSTHGQSVAT